MLLWSGLPTITPVQLRLLSRGPQGLAEPLDTPELREREMVVPRGKNAALIRRLRVGGRELHKLDLVHSELAAPGPSELERVDELAQAISAALLRFTEGLQSRTVLFVFGDHGFVLPPTDRGTGPAQEGGSLPEQVLVPALAWLVGRVH